MKLIINVLLVMSFLISFTVVDATPEMNELECGVLGKIVSVSGVLNAPIIIGEDTMDEISITVLKTKNEPYNSTDLSAVNIENQILQYDVVSATDGKIDYKLTFDDDIIGGYFKVLVGGYGIDEYKAFDLYYTSESEVKKTIITLNEPVSTVTEYLNKITKVVLSIGLAEKESFEKISNKVLFSEILLKARGEGFVNASDLKNSFNSSLKLAKLNEITTTDEIATLLNDNKSVFNVDLLDDRFKLLSDDRKKNVLQELIDIEIKETKIVAQSFFDKCAVETLNSADRTNIENVLSRNKANIFPNAEMLSKYEHLTSEQKQLFLVRMVRPYSNINDVINGVKKLLIDVTAITDDSDQTSNSSSGNSNQSNFTVSGDSNPKTSETIIEKSLVSDESEVVEIEFNDISDAPWAKEAIDFCIKKSIISGKGDNRFEPNSPITKEEFVKIVVNAFEIAPNPKKVKLTDVSEEHWSYPYILKAISCGVVLGNENGTFGIGKELTREELATILFRVLKYKEIVRKPKIETIPADMDMASDYAKSSIENLWQAQVIKGKTKGVFYPKDTATRAEAVEVIYSIIKELK